MRELLLCQMILRSAIGFVVKKSWLRLPPVIAKVRQHIDPYNLQLSHCIIFISLSLECLMIIAYSHPFCILELYQVKQLHCFHCICPRMSTIYHSLSTFTKLFSGNAFFAISMCSNALFIVIPF